MQSSNILVNLVRCSFILRMSCPNSSWISSTTLIQVSNQSPILIPRKQIWEKVFHLISWCAYDAYMHVMKGMKWYVVHKKVWPIMIYYRSMHKQNLEEKGRKKQHLNLIWFFIFSNSHFLVKSHYPDYPLFKKETPSLIIFKHSIFSNNTFLF